MPGLYHLFCLNFAICLLFLTNFCCICLIFSSSFSKSFWNACVNVSTVWWFSFGVHVLLCGILNSQISMSYSLFLKWSFSFTFLMNILMSFLNCFFFLLCLLGVGQKFKILFESLNL